MAAVIGTSSVEAPVYVVAIRLDGRRLFFLWAEDGESYLLADGAGALAAFRTAEEARSHAWDRGFQVSTEPAAEYDLDGLLAWSASPDPATIDVIATLNALNILDDAVVPISLRDGYRGDEAERKLYEKLFWANNLPSLTPEGQRFDPVWTRADAVMLAGMVVRGVKYLRANIHVQQ